VDARSALHARRERREGSADAVLRAGGHAAERDAVQRLRVDETTFNEFTGRFGFDLKPGWFDDSTLYAFFSRGYKAGGFNPPLDRSLPQFAGTPEVYDPEFVNAFEIGSKNVLAGGRVQANLTAFYYKYDALQVSKIVARTSVNENVDANIYGLEGEFVFSPVNDLLIDANFAYLNTEIKDFSSIDPRDPSNGDPDWTNIKDISDGSNCVLATAALARCPPVRLVSAAQQSAVLSASAERWPRTACRAGRRRCEPRWQLAAGHAGVVVQGRRAVHIPSRQQHEPDARARITIGATRSTPASSIGRSTRSTRGTW
jgi:hypothetical protein